MTAEDKKELRAGYVNLRDFFETLWGEREKLLNFRFKAALQAVEDSKKEVEKALVLAKAQTERDKIELKAEHERRFEELNNLRKEYTTDRISDRSHYVRQETYDAEMKEVEKYGTRLTVVETRSVTWTSALAVIFALVQIAVVIWLKYGK
jgi:preprotein translocase subunit SecF